MTQQDRNSLIRAAQALFDSGHFAQELGALVACPTESQRSPAPQALSDYLTQLITPRLTRAGFDCTLHDNPNPSGGPFLVGKRREDPTLPTILIYGHGDVVMGDAGNWAETRDPFTLSETKQRFYGRGAADNKAQHLINIASLEAVIAAQGRLNFNVTLLIEMAEETGSPGLAEFCAQNKTLLAADVLIASDGPRLQADRPTLFLGARGAIDFDLTCNLRSGAHHSGNWGGLLADPAQRLAHALATICDARGDIQVPEWRPTSLTPELQQELDALPVEGGDIAISDKWGHPEFGPGARVFGWNSFAILAMKSGNPDAPLNAIAGHASAKCQLRFVVGTDPDQILPALRKHLTDRGFPDVEVIADPAGYFNATRHNRDHPWVRLVEASLRETAGCAPHLLPNLGGSLPNEIFTDILEMPTIWVPHSYRGCSQHAPDEHVLKSICREGLGLMAGLWWDIGQTGHPQ
ncbi:MAG: M20 family metallopeptidase [Sulfitobacter sp.]